MKKYKIIKTYPGSDKLGTVITLDKNGECWSTPQLVIENDCKNNPEFFEEIIEEEYEILELYTTNHNDHYFLREDGNYSFKGVEYGNSFKTCQEYGWKIFSIKRLSDNEVFSIGDELVDTFNRNQGKFTLKEIEFEKAPCDKGTGKLSFVHTHTILGKYIPLERLEKAKPVLFVTEDGKNVFEGDNIHWIRTDKIVYLYNTRACFPHQKTLLVENNIYKIFSSFEKAQEWIILNKPVLSVNDVDKYTEQFNAGEWLNKLKEVVKSRL